MVVLTQTHLIESTYHQYSTHHSHSTIRSKLGKISLPSNLTLFGHTKEPNNECLKTVYQALVGSLLFIARMTGPEITIHVNLLGRTTEDLLAANLLAARKVLEYLYSSRQEGIILKKPSNLALEVYADVSYGGPESRSQTGVLTTLGGQPMGWYSRRQDIVSLSITEAEYIACCKGAKDLA